MRNSNFDVVVMGGGPAGCTTATFLAQKGYRVILFEKEGFPRFHIGESLLPGIWDIWDALGISSEMEAEGFLRKEGVNFALFNEAQDITLLTGEFPEYFRRTYSYHVERARFDEILLNFARRNGVEVRERWTVKDVLFEGGRAIGALASPTGEETQPISYLAPVIVDATGRFSLLARKLGFRKPDPALNRVAYFTHFKGAYSPGRNGFYKTDIHTIDGGWLWYIPLANDIVSVGVVVNSKYDFGTKDIQARFDQAVASCPRIHDWIGSASQVIEVKVISNISYLNDSFVGDGFVMVGDASMFVDPIFSAGVTLAMRGGKYAAETIHDAFDAGDFSASRLRTYESRIRYPMNNIFKMIYNWYHMLQVKDRNNLFFRSRKIPILRERLVVIISGGYERTDLEEFLKEEELRLMDKAHKQMVNH